MNEEDEIIWAVRISLTCAPTNVNCTEQYLYGDGRSMSEDGGTFGLRLVGEPSETTCSHRPRKRIRPGIVWQAAYGVHSEQVIGSSFPKTPYTH